MDRMQAAGLSRPAIASFRLHFDRLVRGSDGLMTEEAIEPVGDLPDAAEFDVFRRAGIEALERTAVIKLNGGLGTGMGLEGPKSLLEVRDGRSFLDLIVGQILSLRTRYETETPLLLMNSFRTRKETERVLGRTQGLEIPGIPMGFLQGMVPKILADRLLPAERPDRPELEWCPPGHGDLYTAISDSSLLPTLLDHGIEYAFVSNADNLGGVLEPDLLGFMVEEGVDFMLEAADRTMADRKGGHLCRHAGGRLALRESAQCPTEARSAFQDVERYAYFNTNNLWLHLPSLAQVLQENGGFLPLPSIVNHKTLDPRDPTTPEVLQLETAMGSAISLFERAVAVRVPRSRFSPVKNTDDLLGARSDAFRLTDDSRVVLHPDRQAPPVITLDQRYYKLIDEFERRFPAGPPSLLGCESLEVTGDVTFGAGIVIEGSAGIRTDGKARVPDDTSISGTLILA